MSRLLIKNGDSALQTHELSEGRHGIGRSLENTVVLDHDSVSSRHAEIEVQNGRAILRDLKSVNGTAANGKPVTEITLQHGDRITFAGIECVFESNDRLDARFDNSFSMEDGADFGIVKTVSVFKSLDYGFLLPFRKIFSQGLLKKKAVRWVMIFGLSPIAIFVSAVHFELSFKETVWLLSGYFCLFWALYFHNLIQPGKTIWRRAIGYSLFTAFVGVPLVLFSQNIPLLRDIYELADGDHFLERLFGMVVGIGLMEEICKALPLLLFGLRKGTLRSVREGLFLGFMSGLGFAAAEGVAYSLGATLATIEADSYFREAAYTVQLLQIVFRMMTGPILHAAWAGIVGWFIGLAANRPEPRWPIITVGIGFMALVHGTNNLASGTIFHLLIGAISILILMAYLTHDEEKSAETVGAPLPKTEPETAVSQ